MKIVNSNALCIVGILFFIQAAIISTVFLSKSPPADDDFQKVSLYISELHTGQFVKSLAGSLFGCLGSFLLLIYLRVRALEKRIETLMEKKENPLSPNKFPSSNK